MHQFRIVIEEGPANYSAYSPDLLGCIATGASREETEANMREAIAFHLDALREDGQLVPVEYAITVIDDPRQRPLDINNLEYVDEILFVTPPPNPPPAATKTPPPAHHRPLPTASASA